MLSAEESARSTFFCPNCRETRYVIPPPPNPNEAYCGMCGTRLMQRGPDYAGFWIRFVGYFIDYIVVSVAGFVLGAIIGLAGAGSDGALLLAQLAGFVAGVAYVVIGNAEGGTLGKRAVGLRITDLEGNKPGYGRATGRLLMSIVSGLVLLLGYILMVASPKKQTWHDSVAGTIVVRHRSP